MTSEQAIELLDNLIGMVEDNQDNDYDSALRMAIEALKQPELSEHRICHTCIHQSECPWSNTDNGYCHKWLKNI